MPRTGPNTTENLKIFWIRKKGADNCVTKLPPENTLFVNDDVEPIWPKHNHT